MTVDRNTISDYIIDVDAGKRRQGDREKGMIMKALGTVLPTAAILRKAAAHSDAMARQRERLGDDRLRGLDKRVVGGEVRYYDTTDQYAIVSRQGRVLWFQVTPDGDMRM